MATLELAAPKNKKVHVVLVEYEHKIPWTMEETSKFPPTMYLPVISPQYRNFVVEVVKDKQPAFACEELGLREEEEFWHDNPLVVCFEKMGVPYKPVDISENAKFYLESTNEISDLVRSLRQEIDTHISEPGFKRDRDFEQLVTWYQYATSKAQSFSENVRFNVREAWMTMGLIDMAKRAEGKEVTGLMIADASHFTGFTKLFAELGFTHEQVEIDRKQVSIDEIDMETVRSRLPTLEISVKQAKKPKQKMQSILYFMDTDEYASPFDINMAYDAGFDVVVPLPRVTGKTARKLTEDAMFSRGPKGANYTAIMVGGSNVPEAEKIFNVVQKTMFPPFQLPVFADPRGGYTTSAAAVVKAMVSFKEMKDRLGPGKKAAVLGCGPVGRTTAMILASLGCDTTLVETAPADMGFSIESALALTQEANEMAGLTDKAIQAAFADSDETKLKVLAGMDVIFAMGAPGIELVGKGLLPKLVEKGLQVVCDINAVPPAGISGVKASMKNKPHKRVDGLRCNGALAIGVLKRDAEYALLKAAKVGKNKVIYGWRQAFLKATELALGEAVDLVVEEIQVQTK